MTTLKIDYSSDDVLPVLFEPEDCSVADLTREPSSAASNERRECTRPSLTVVSTRSSGRTLPCAPDHERGLLASIFHAPDRVLGELLDLRMTEEYFHIPAHAILYRHLLGLWQRKLPIELISVTDSLERAGELEFVGGAALVADIYAFLGSGANWAYYLDTLRERRLARETIRIAQDLLVAAYDPAGASEIARVTQESLVQIAALQESRAETQDMGSVMVQTTDHIEAVLSQRKLPGLATGLRPLDEALQGLQPGQMITIAAQTKRGKTTLALNIAAHVASQGAPVGVLSLEMNVVELGTKLLTAHARVDLSGLGEGYIPPEDMDRLAASCHQLRHYPIFVRDECVVTNVQFRAAARRLVHQQKCRLLIVDYLQLITPEGSEQNRERQVAETSRTIKTTAAELGIPIIVLSQLNENDRSRESRSIENDSNAFLIIEETPVLNAQKQPSYDEKGHPQTTHHLWIKYARHCPNQRIPVTFDKATGVFREKIG